MDKNRLLPVSGVATLTGLHTQVAFRKIQAGEIGPAWAWDGNELKKYKRGGTRELYVYENDILSYIHSRQHNKFALYPVGEPCDDPGEDARIPVPFSIAAERLNTTYNQLRGAATRGEIDRWAYTSSGVNMRKYLPDEEEEPSSGRRPTAGRSVYVFERDLERYREAQANQEIPEWHHELTPDEDAQARAIAAQQIAEQGHVVISELVEAMGKAKTNMYFRRGVQSLAKKEGWTLRGKNRK